jgi:D-tyrosyl-tRNA(Tyr) deacylase
LAVLLAVEEADTVEDIEWLSGKIVRLRVFDDEKGVMNRSVQDAQGGILLISQFTLFASTKKGNRPSYSRSARPETAVPLYEQFIARLEQELGKPIETGEFGAEMQVSLTNDQGFWFLSREGAFSEQFEALSGACGDALKDLAGGAPGTAQHWPQQRRAQQCQRTGRVLVSQPTPVLAPERIAPPVVGVLHRPLAPRQRRQVAGTGLLGRQAGDEVTGVLGGVAVLFEGGGVARVENLPGAGKGQRVGFDLCPAHSASFDATAVGFGLGKRGVAPASFRWVFCRTVG